MEVLGASLVARLPDCTFERPAGGVCLWLRLPRGTDDTAVMERALALGVTVSPGRAYMVGEPEHPYLRLSFATIDASSIDEAVRRLADAVRTAPNSSE
jgi:DNA-binding transcriptional MocR family regulator